MAGSADLGLMREARKVFVRHWIDLGRISLRCTKGSLHVRGTLLKMQGTGEELTESSVNNLFAELKRIRGLKRIYTTLENWQEMSLGVWKSTDDSSSSSDGSSATSAGEGKTITFKDL